MGLQSLGSPLFNPNPETPDPEPQTPRPQPQTLHEHIRNASVEVLLSIDGLFSVEGAITIYERIESMV